jgi:hypothetical protein
VSHAFLPPKKRRKHTFFGNMVRYARREAARKRKRGVDDTRYLPGDEPILWRDTMNTYLEWPHGVRGTLIVVMAPLLLVAVLVALGSRQGQESLTFGFFVAATWVLGGIAILTRSSTLFAEERANRTLEVFLTTPLSSAEIVRQKARVPRRLALLVAVPLGALVVIESLVEFQPHRSGGIVAQLAYLGLSALAVFVLLPTLYWMGLLIGLRIHNRTRASVVAMAAALAWNFGPSMLLAFVPYSLRGTLGWAVGLLTIMSPWRIVAIAEAGFARGFRGGYGAHLGGLTAALGGLAINAGLFLLLRHACLRNADRWLGRPAPSARGGDAAGRAPRAEGGIT